MTNVRRHDSDVHVTAEAKATVLPRLSAPSFISSITCLPSTPSPPPSLQTPHSALLFSLLQQPPPPFSALHPVFILLLRVHILSTTQSISPRRSSALDRGEKSYRVWVVLVQQSTSKRVHLPRMWRRRRGRKRRRSRRRPESMCLNRD